VELGKLKITYQTGGEDYDYRTDAVLFKIYQYNQLSHALPLADVPMPENIKNFKEIYIRFILCFSN
jgi:hypothetical protein